MQRKTHNKLKSSTIGALVILAGVLLGVLAFPSLRQLLTGVLEASNQEEVQPVKVVAAPVERSTLHPSLNVVGQIVAIPELTAVVSSQAGGWVDQIEVVEGQSVHAGEVLLTLDPRAAESALRRVQATLAEKKAVLARLKKGYLPEEIEAAQEVRDGAQATVEGLQSELSALQDLLNRKEISQVQFQTKQKALEAAQAALDGAEAKLQLLENGTRPEAIAEAQAQADAAAADVKTAELAVEWCTVRCPIDGVVVQLAVRRGQFFDRAVSLATIIDLSKVFAQIRVPSDALAGISVGTKVDLQVTAFPNVVLHGEVTRLSGEADVLTGDITAYVSIENSDGRLKPGLGCSAHIWLPEIPGALAVPAQAVADHAGTPVVTVIRDAKAVEAPVTVGVKSEGLVQIVSGLSVGDVVATQGGYALPDGYPVEVVSDSSNGNLK